LFLPAPPAEIIGVLYRESAKILAQPDMKERLAGLGYDLVASTPKEFATRMATEIEMWAKVIRAANIKPQ
jgi:tripartite-type tricarboxylate transporter receptor subunit TctC